VYVEINNQITVIYKELNAILIFKLYSYSLFLCGEVTFTLSQQQCIKIPSFSSLLRT